MRGFFRWIIPGGGLFLLAIALKMGVGPDGLVEGLVTGYPWAVYATTFSLAIFFHRSRVAVALLALAGTAWIGTSRAGGFTAFFFAGGVLALILGTTSLLKDRGLLTKPGLLQFGVAAVVAFLSAFFIALAPQDMAAFMAAMPLPLPLTLWSGFPQPVFVAFALALPTTFVAALVRKGPVERGTFWAVILTALALSYSADIGMMALFLMAGGLTLGISVVEASHAMAYKDDLTGLPGRRALGRDLDGLGSLYTTAMVDVDHFKIFNDLHGHDVGDQVLRMVAAQLGKAPGGGRAYRYGGEEFTILFSGKAREEALPHLDQTRRDVEAATFTLRNKRRPRKKPVDAGSWNFANARKPSLLSVTVSIGVADSTGSDLEPEAVLMKADRALYRAKKAGRNRVSK
jgi:diguanylate cyclase (GGDEF)-like protein